jgi:hypothetical protein
MKQPLLSILIPTVPSRKEKFNRLLRGLNAQKNALPNPEEVEIITLEDNGEITIGAKRNKLLDMANGTHLCYIDDDDRVFSDYLELIIDTLHSHPDVDVIGMTIFWTEDIYKKPRLLVRTPEYKTLWFVKDTDQTVTGGRTAHWNPTKASIAKSEKFPDVQKGEDAAWSAKISNKIKTFVMIDVPLYHYDYRTQETLTKPSLMNIRPNIASNHQYVMRDGHVTELDETGKVVKVLPKGRTIDQG